MVFTFYSYKGGVGRTMALANIASLLYKRGLRVLLIDFDLEAPSLEEYFKVVKNKKEEQFGFIDMLVDYKKNISQEHTDTDTKTNPSITLPLQGIDKYIFKVPNDIQKDGSLLLLTSGKKDDNYVKNVHSFDWEDFMLNWEGEIFFKWLKRELKKYADVVFVDSRTGSTNIGRLSTTLLADSILMFTAMSSHTFKGLIGEANRIISVRKQAQNEDVEILIIPGRIENSELLLQNEFRKNFLQDIAPIVSTLFTPEELWEMSIPYVPYYALGYDILENNPEISILSRQYNKIADAIIKVYNRKSNLTPYKNNSSEDIFSSGFGALMERKLSNASIFISYAKEDKEKVKKIYQKLKQEGFRPWLDEENLQAGQDWKAEIEKSIESSDFVITCLSNKSIHKRGFVQKEIVWALDFVEKMPEDKVYLIPIRLEECEIPRRLNRYHCLNIFTEEDLGRLIEDIRLHNKNI